MRLTKRQLNRIIREAIQGSYSSAQREEEPYPGYLEEQCLDFIEQGNNYSGWLDWSMKYMDDEEASDMWDRIHKTEQGSGESNEVLQFVEDSLENGYPVDEISSELRIYFSRIDLQAAFDSEDIEGWSMAEDIISAALV